MYDITKKRSFEKLNYYIKNNKEFNTKEVIIVITTNKLDNI